MKILILGYSNLAKRKIIPALKKIDDLKFDIASVTSSPVNNGHTSWYRNYKQALKSSSAKIVYVSLVNSLHYRFINEAISLRKHVIVDKPIALDNYEVLKLIKKAKKNKLILSEALTFNYHKQFSELKKIISKNKPIKNIIMKFIGLISGGKDSIFNILECIKAGHECVCLGNLHYSGYFYLYKFI